MEALKCVNPNNITPWKKEGDWKARYHRLYSSQRQISFSYFRDVLPPGGLMIWYGSQEAAGCMWLAAELSGGQWGRPMFNSGRLPADMMMTSEMVSYKLYQNQPRIDESNRISFLSQDNSPYTSLLLRLRAKQRDDAAQEPPVANSAHTLLAPNSDTNTSNVRQLDHWGGCETLLLDMVRARSRSFADESLDKRLELPPDNEIDENDYLETCMHGLSMPMTERSVSRSRVSRISTRRDMDIPSILAFTTTSAPAPVQIPAFQGNRSNRDQEDIPRWSIRRSVCPVCSQKWRDRSSIDNVKYSGLKRNSSQELPSVIAPARLRTSIMIGYQPRPALAAVDEDAGLGHSALRNTSASWQLTRARRFRIPKPQMPSEEDRAPPISTAPLARKDLDIRVNKFLSDEQAKRKA